MGCPRVVKIENFVAAAAPGEEIAASVRPRDERLDTAHERLQPSWGPHRIYPRRGGRDGSGEVRTTLSFGGGEYRIWVAGSFGRDLSVLLDGQEVGRVSGVNTEGEWLDGGVVRITAGSHDVGLKRAGGGLAPGDGYVGFLGPLVFEPVYPNRPARVDPA